MSAEPSTTVDEGDSGEGGRRSTVVRSVWTVADQLLSSVTNFGVGIAVASSVSAHDFGAFAIVFAAYLVALGISRALATEPLLVRATPATPVARKHAIQAATGLVIAIGLVAGTLLAAAGLLIGDVAGRALIAVAICLPGLLLQDAWRFAFFADARPARAAGNDLTWAIALAVLLGIALITGVRSTPLLVLSWGVAGSLAGCVGIIQAKTGPRLGAALAWLRKNRDLNVRFLAEFFLTMGAGQGIIFVLALLSGLAATGDLQAGYLLLGPINVVLQSANLVGVAELARRVNSTEPDTVRGATLVSAGAVVATTVWLVCAALLPDAIGHSLLGASWKGAKQVFLPLAVWAVLSSAMVGASCGLRALGDARSTLRLRTLISLLALAFAFPLILVGGAFGAASALPMAMLMVLPLWWRVLWRDSCARAEERPRLAGGD